jgi:hypothetical protein
MSAQELPGRYQGDSDVTPSILPGSLTARLQHLQGREISAEEMASTDKVDAEAVVLKHSGKLFPAVLPRTVQPMAIA